MSLTTDRRAASPEYATASQLALWPQTHAREAQDRLPELVRRLLFETPEAGQISIRTRDGVTLAGKDGVATLERQTRMLPAGRIWFEFGTDKNIKLKATKDYEARKAEASTDVVFVFVTVRRWQGKDAWAAERRDEHLFKDVLVLDADDLEAWLQSAPAAHLWVSERLGLRPRDALTLEGWWDRFSAATEPTLPLPLFVAGRHEEVQRLRALLAGEARVVSIQTEWVDDALGFLHASLSPDDEDSGDAAAVTIVRSADAWDRIVSLPGAGILVPDFDSADVGRALASGWHVVSIIGNGSAVRRSVDIRLPRVARDEAAEAFRIGDVEWRRADRLAVLARRSMPALARHLSRSPRVKRPAWSQPPLADMLAALMLVSRWTDQSEDLDVLTDLSSVPTTDLRRAIADASLGPDPAIRSAKGVSVFVSLEEAFLQLEGRVSSDLALRWTEIAIDVLSDPNSNEGMPPKERIAAQLNPPRRTHSRALRRGFAESIALAGAVWPAEDASNNGCLAAQRVVREVLNRAVSDADNRTWALIADVLPLLAEAAPDVFLCALEDDLATNQPTVGHLFQMIDDPLTLGAPGQHHHLLWALEVLCWSPEYLVRATQILTKIRRYELPKNSGNTPLGSMSSVLCGWIRNTGADLPTRLRALDACWHLNAATGWALLKSLWPDTHATVSPPSEPRYQLWKPATDRVSHNEWSAFVTGLVDRALQWASFDRTALPWLVDGLATAGPSEADRIIEFLEEQAARDDLSEDVQLALFEKLRETAARHKRFQNAEWAMPPERWARLENLANLFQPADDLRQLAYLFSWHPVLPDADVADYEKYSTLLDAERRRAFDALFARPDGWDQLAAVTIRAEAPSRVGWALSAYAPVDALHPMLKWLASEEASLHQAAGTWVRSHLAVDGPADLRRALENTPLGSQVRRRLVLSIPTASQFWDVLRDYPDAEELFWSEAAFEVVPDNDLTNAITLLLAQERAWAAIAVASHGIFEPTAEQVKHLPSPALVLSILREAITQDPGADDPEQMTGYCIGELLDYLESAEVPVADLASVEFSYFRLLEHSREPRALNQTLATDPSLFVDLVRRAFRGANQPRRQSTSADPLAEHSWWILRGWHGFPGRQADGLVDEVGLHEWVRKARLQLSDLDRSDIGDELIGQTFAMAPADIDGIWPPVPVRELIESIGSRNLENGVITGRLNSRGVTWRGVYEGGAQERTLAKQYKEWSLETQGRWPRTARILRTISAFYERDAVREDDRAQLDQDLD